jgi:hypothetical protein
MRRVSVVALCVLAAVAATPARGETISRGRETKILRVALRAARFAGERHPKDIIAATGTLANASRVIEPPSEGMSFFPAGAAPGDAGSIVYLVAMHGHFTANKAPHGHRAPKGRVEEIIIDAATERVESLFIGPGVRVPLSHLGPVTRLR